MIQLVCRFNQTDAAFLDRAKVALALLAAQPTCEGLRMARSTEDAASWVLTAEFETFPGYRAALSPLDVRITVVPFLSEADQFNSGVFEVILQTAGDATQTLTEDSGLIH